MSQVYTRESRGEILVVLKRHAPDRLTAMEDAVRILEREIILERAKPDRNKDWNPKDQI